MRRSSDDILLYAVDSIIQELDKKHIVCCAFLDVRKAFDSLDHVILLQRLAALGVSHTSLKWFQNYIYLIVLRWCSMLMFTLIGAQSLEAFLRVVP